jgi:glycerophosphoryl diester phosphodiesterase
LTIALWRSRRTTIVAALRRSGFAGRRASNILVDGEALAAWQAMERAMFEGTASRSFGDLRSRWIGALGFHLLIQLLGFALFTPLATWLARRMVLASGEPVISNFDIADFVLSPAGIGFVLLVAAVTIGLLLAEFAGHTWIAGHALARRHVGVIDTVAFVLRRLPSLLRLALRVFLRLVLLALPFLALAGVVWFTMLAGHDINYYLAESPPEWRRARLIAIALGAGFLLLAAWQLARWLYAVPILVFENATPAAALDRGAEMTRGRLGRIVPPLLLWWLLLTLVALAITWVCRQVSDAGLDWAGVDLRRVLPLVALYLAVSIVGGFLYGGLGLAGHQFLVTRLYAEQRDPERVRLFAQLSIPDGAARSLARPAILVTLTLSAAALGFVWLLGSQLDLTREVAVTAHRGASAVAPENSMAAFRAAMDAGAGYSELDVQRTRDGEIVVMHDGDLLRMGGDPRKIAQMAAADIAAVDIGRGSVPPMTGEHPPTLAEVIALVRGRMKLNIELKYNVPDPGLAPAVVELLRREDFLGQAVITSLDYAALKQVRKIEPGLRTGHIITASVGDVLGTEADFLSLSSAQAKSRLVRRAHRAGKDVHVWTINQPEVALRMIERGVDNIITDDPAMVTGLMRRREELSTAEVIALRMRVLFARPPRELNDPAAVEAL